MQRSCEKYDLFFMFYITYILYSKELDRYYTGSSSLSISERLEYHLHNHKGFTSKAKDWEVKFVVDHQTVQEARALERKIKKRGAKRFLDN